MKTSMDYQEELEALRSEMLRQRREEAQELLNKPQEELSSEELQKKKRKRIISNITLILFAAMIITGLMGKFLEKPFLIGAAAVLMGVIIVIVALTKDFQKKRPLKIRYIRIKADEIIKRTGFCAMGLYLIAIVILILAGYEDYLIYLIFGMFGIFFIMTAASGMTPYFYVKKKTKHLKSVCTEAATAKCIDKNEKDRFAIIKEEIELMPVYVNVKTTSRSSVNRYVKSFCSPVYEIYYGGQTYTLCDNNYNNFKIPQEGQEREILINPDNPLEFYDSIRYKKELSTALGHAVMSVFAMLPFIMFFVFFIVMYNA